MYVYVHIYVCTCICICRCIHIATQNVIGGWGGEGRARVEEGNRRSQSINKSIHRWTIRSSINQFSQTSNGTLKQ